MGGLSQFIWDEKEKKVCGRSSKGWAEICAFFVVFYIVLLSYFCGMLSIFFQTLSDRSPKLTHDKSFLKTPGLAVRPLVQMDSGRDFSTLIFFTDDIEEKHTEKMVNSIKQALRPYWKAYNDSYAKYWSMCGSGSANNSMVTANTTRPCIVDYEHLLVTDKCSLDNNFGYPDGKPCVLVRLNKIYGWKPDTYSTSSSVLPNSLTDAVDAWVANGRDKVDGDLIWLYCYGADPVDKDLLDQEIEYFPYQGFPATHYPYYNQYRYLQPVVFVKFNSVPPNVAIKVRCRVYAKNVEYHTSDWTGGFHFELFYKKKN